MTRPLISSASFKGDPVTEPQSNEPQKMSEYEYYVGHIKTTALLTEKMAKRLGAKPVGEAEAPEVGGVDNNEAGRMSTSGREADDAGVVTTNPDGTDSEETATKARTARNKRAS